MGKRLGFVGVGLLLLGVLLWSVVFTSSPLESLESSQPVTAERYINQGTNDLHVFVFYKPTCPICRKYGKDISDVLSKVNKEDYSVVNVSSGIPEYLESYFIGFSFEGVHVPYVVISRGSEIVYSQRVDSSNALSEFQNNVEDLKGS